MKRIRLAVILAAILLTSALCSCDLFSDLSFFDLPDIGLSADSDQERYNDMPVVSKEIGSHDDEYGYHILNRFEFSYATGYEANRTAHSYDALSGEMHRKMYNLFHDAVYCFSDEGGTFTGEYKMRPLLVNDEIRQKDVETALTALLDDHPEIFWMATDFDLVRFGKTVSVTLNARYTADQVLDMMHKLDDSLSSFFGDFPENLSEYERETAVYRYIIADCAYDNDVESADNYSDTHPSIYNLYGVMVDRKAVCEGYSRAFDYLCSQVGVDAVCTCGTSDTEYDEDVDISSGLHMWNAVKLDGEWYWADCTWDDWDEDEDLGDVFYYLNITDKLLSVDHTVDKTYANITDDEYNQLGSYINSFVPPACTATEYCYYLREGVILTAPDAGQLADGFAAAAEKDRKSLLIIVDNDEYTPETFADALFAGSQPYYEALDIANDRLGNVRLDDNADAVYYTDDDRKMLIFEICYE